jgi:4'-phosphopantetheinyl transferase
VYFARPERHDAAALERAYRLLDAEERERAARFRFERDRALYVLAHALLRRELERYTGVAAQALRFECNASGRPELSPAFEPGGAPLRFNLAHTRGLVGCAITTGADIGFDVEQVREPAPVEIAARFFSAPELVALRALPPEQQGRRFFTLWSLKEAYVKARGVGIGLGLGCFALTPRPEGLAELEMLDAHPPDSRPWAFRWWHFDAQCAAIAMQTEPGQLRPAVFDEELF